MTKKISKTGSVHISKELRTELGMPLGSAVDIKTDEKSIIISKHVPICSFCDSVTGVIDVLGIEICKPCALKIKKRIDEIND